jgi:hypothetical protein
VADLHEVIVDDDGEVVRRKPVGFEQDLVVDIGVVEAHVAADHVVPYGGAIGHPESHHRGHTVGSLQRHLGLPRETPAVVAGRLRACALRFTHGGEAYRRAGAPVGVAVLDQPVRVLAVRGDPQRLDVWGVRAFDLGSLGPGEPEPAEGLEDERLCPGDVAFLVGVLDPQDEGAAVVPGGKPCEQGRPNRPEMQRAGWGRRETGANPRVGHYDKLSAARRARASGSSMPATRR